MRELILRGRRLRVCAGVYGAVVAVSHVEDEDGRVVRLTTAGWLELLDLVRADEARRPVRR